MYTIIDDTVLSGRGITQIAYVTPPHSYPNEATDGQTSGTVRHNLAGPTVSAVLT